MRIAAADNRGALKDEQTRFSPGRVLDLRAIAALRESRLQGDGSHHLISFALWSGSISFRTLRDFARCIRIRGSVMECGAAVPLW
jgi:hypothetical protein